MHDINEQLRQGVEISKQLASADQEFSLQEFEQSIQHIDQILKAVVSIGQLQQFDNDQIRQLTIIKDYNQEISEQLSRKRNEISTELAKLRNRDRVKDKYTAL